MRKDRIAIALMSVLPGCIVDTETMNGAPGLACWDSNGNGIQDQKEDANGDGAWDSRDCVGPEGADGATGSPGADGVSPFSYVDSTEKTDVYYDGGNVTIGAKSTSKSKLTVRDSLIAGETALTVGNSAVAPGETSETASIEFGFTDTGALIRAGKEDDFTSPEKRMGYLSFWTNRANDTTEKVRITSAGTVGVGTTDPLGWLHLTSPTSASDNFSEGLRIDRGQVATQYGVINMRGGALRFISTGIGGNGGHVFSASNNGTDELQRMVIDDAGNVGIGVTAPQAKLHVQGTTAQDASIQLSFTDPAGVAIVSMNPTGAAGGGDIQVYGPQTSAPNTVFISSNGTPGVNGSVVLQSGDHGAGGTFLQVNPSGVRIGTTLPVATLDINGTARLKAYSGQAPFTCDDVEEFGTIALDVNYDICICKPNGWRHAEGGTLCTWP